MFDYKKHRQFRYSLSTEAFHAARSLYYLDEQQCTPDASRTCFERDLLGVPLDVKKRFFRAVEKMTIYAPTIFIITATANRHENLRRLFQSILDQVTDQRIGWIVVDNSDTLDRLTDSNRWLDDHSWIATIKYSKPFGYAAPARNRGLAFLRLIASNISKESYFLIIDDDDFLHNPYVLSYLYKEARKPFTLMAHGYAHCLYYEHSGLLTHRDVIPRNIGASHPNVSLLKDEFDMGPQIISAMIPCRHLSDIFVGVPVLFGSMTVQH